ncbi:hypothetical protein QA639_34960 [Bradyrhizobium pachyrhizi]|uniref:hypothetical protein n=1 Tax=Bradyrhizobium pachyrhizi TaxID=280333 RepID=UPI0024B0999C|nr:hypothetical protein [Bradyrhizobium pachyrhizi]WFU54739.1 hypothetical protein QA639_34960 [Bradyrhizobium pachyrhizi]
MPAATASQAPRPGRLVQFAIDFTAGRADLWHWPSRVVNLESRLKPGKEETPLVTTACSRKTFIAKQRQYLAYSTSTRGCTAGSPAEADMQEYFRISSPSVH